MAEFMNDDRPEVRTMGVGEVVGVVDSSAAVVICVYEDDDMFVGRACQYVVQLLEMEGSQITVAIEGVEMGSEGRIFPDALCWPACATVFR